MIARLASSYSPVRAASSGSASAVASAEKISGETNPPNSSLRLTADLHRRRTCR